MIGRRILIAWFCGAAMVAWTTETRAEAGSSCGSPLALALLEGRETPELVLAQRVIERDWAVPGDSSFTQPIPGWRSEPLALSLSALVPGAGQLYSGERSGYLFALAEVVGWVGWALFKGDSKDLRDEAVGIAGSPGDSASSWSYERWQDATQGDPSQLQALYDADREAFYDAIADDGSYAEGWSSSDSRVRFRDLRERSDRKLQLARRAATALWLNHLLAAADALRAAHINNLPLRRNLELKARGGWQDGRPAFRVAVQRSF